MAAYREKAQPAPRRLCGVPGLAPTDEGRVVPPGQSRPQGPARWALSFVPPEAPCRPVARPGVPPLGRPADAATGDRRHSLSRPEGAGDSPYRAPAQARTSRNTGRGPHRAPGGAGAPARPRLADKPRTYQPAVAPIGSRMWLALANQGFDPEHAEREAETRLRAKALRWCAGLITDTGRDLGLAIATCGRPMPALYGGEVVLASQRCRARFCPRCQKLRSRELAEDVRAVVEIHERDGQTIWYVTLTQPKPDTADPAVPIGNALRFWRRLTNRKTRRGRAFHSLFRGALRSLEVTWSPRGAARRDGSTVEYDGWHAHFHLLVEGGSPSAVRWLVTQWCELVSGSVGAQDAQRADERRIGQLCKYVVKPLVTCPPEHGRELVRVLHRKRLLEGVGTWKHWRREVPARPPEPPVLFADVDLARLSAIVSNKWERESVDIRFAGFDDGEPVEGWMAPVEVAVRCKRWLSEARRERREKAASSTLATSRAPPGVNGSRAGP